jgi:hypothetical protein
MHTDGGTCFAIFVNVLELDGTGQPLNESLIHVIRFMLNGATNVPAAKAASAISWPHAW